MATSLRLVLGIVACLVGLPAGAAVYARTSADGVLTLTNVPEGDGYRVLEALDGGACDPPAEPVPQARPYEAVIAEAARLHGLDSALLHAVVAVESGYNAAARSPRGAVGLMQLMPDTARRYGVTDLLDPRQNLRAGARYLRDLLELFDTDVGLALAAYNAGENRVLRNGRRIPQIRETLEYVPRVLERYRRLRAAPAR